MIKALTLGFFLEIFLNGQESVIFFSPTSDFFGCGGRAVEPVYRV